MKTRRVLLAVTVALAGVIGLAGPAAADPLTDGTAAPYDRAKAVRWALDNAGRSQPFPAACTWFVSNALWAGEMRPDPDWNAQGRRGLVRKRPGTVSATAAQPLLDYLTRRYEFTKVIPLDFGVNEVPAAQPGDIIAYDWTNDGSVDHLAFVVGIAPGAYPEVAEWGVGSQAGSGYTKRGWTYSELSHGWLQAHYRAVSARLFHLDTRTVLRF